jgi:hypothetical protein
MKMDVDTWGEITPDDNAQQDTQPADRLRRLLGHLHAHRPHRRR